MAGPRALLAGGAARHVRAVERPRSRRRSPGDAGGVRRRRRAPGSLSGALGTDTSPVLLTVRAGNGMAGGQSGGGGPSDPVGFALEAATTVTPTPVRGDVPR